MNTSTSLPSMHKSNLSKPEFKYDLVVGTTAKAINATMKQWLVSINDDSTKSLNLIFKSIHQRGQPETTKQMTQAEYQAIVTKSGVDILTFANGNYDIDHSSDFKKFATAAVTGDSQTKTITRLKSIVKLNMGVPHMRLDEIPDIVELPKDSISDVFFTLLFSSYTIIRMDYDPDYGTSANVEKSNITTPGELSCKYRVKLNLQGIRFNELPQSVQTKIKNLNGDTMFEVSQLYMDLTTAHLMTEPVLTVSSDIRLLLSDALVKVIKQFKATNHDGEDAFVFGYLAKNPQQPVKSSIKPTNLDFMVSPYHTSGNPKPKLNTLNYLVMADNHGFPVNKTPFSWNWVGIDEQNIHGVMAIRKGEFVDFFVKAMNEKGNPLDDILFQPTVVYKAWFDGGDSECSVAFGLNKEANPEKRKYEKQENGNIVLKKDYHCHAEDSATSGSVVKFTGKANADYYFNSTISFEKKSIKIYAKARYAIYAETPVFHNGASSKNYANYTYNATYELSASNGKLSLNRITNKIDNNSSPATNNRAIDNINNMQQLSNIDYRKIGTVLRNAFKDYTNDLDTFLKKSFNGWIFPGTTTFTFADIQFSENLDLVAAITYKSPTE